MSKKNEAPPEPKVNYGPAGEEKVSGWKKEFGKVGFLQVEADGLQYYAYLHRPDVASISLALTHRRESPVKAGEVIVQNCLLECSPQIKQDPVIYTSVCLQAMAWLNKLMPMPTIETF